MLLCLHAWGTTIPAKFTEQQIVDRDRSDYLAFVEREKLSDRQVCSELLTHHLRARNRTFEAFEKSWERRRILQANLPAYDWKTNIHFHYDLPGLQISIEQTPYSGSLHLPEIKNFRLIYDPSKFSVFSVIRRMFGNTPLNYTIEDIRTTSESMFASEEGKVAEIYFRGTNSSDDIMRDNGGMIMITRDTGRIRFWPPGTDVDGEMEGILKGSLSALGGFALGLIGETQNAIHRYQGSWFTDKQIIDVTPTDVKLLPTE